MTRFLHALAFALTVGLVVVVGLAVVEPSVAVAQPAPPTPAQLDAAKQAYTDGKALHDAGNLAGAVDKFKESYRLSKNPLLLYNIGLTLDELKKSPLALVYYRKFLNEAPKDVAQRQEVTDRVAALEKQIEDADLEAGSGGSDATKPVEPTPPVTPPVTPPSDPHGKPIKPAGTYKAEDFQHAIVTEAPPGKPLDLSAFVPDDSGFVVTMYFRGAGESSFTAKAMHWRYKELVARIPAAKMTGTAIQYYIEVKDAQGNVVTRSGKSTSPNVVDVDASASPRFYPDLNDDDRAAVKPPDDNPLHPGSGSGSASDAGSGDTTPSITGGGFTDVGSKKFEYAKWGSTGAAVVLLGASIFFASQAGKQADALRADSGLDTTTGKPCTAPCHTFDGYDADLESSGKRDQTLSRIGLGLGIVGAGIAGYYWYRELKGPGSTTPTEKPNEPAKPAHDELGWIIVPAVGDGFTGAAAAARF